MDDPGEADRLRQWLLELYREMDYAAYLRTAHWQEVRAQAIRRAGKRCQLCGGDGGGASLHVHHASYNRLGHEAPEDLTVLCEWCHEFVEREFRKST